MILTDEKGRPIPRPLREDYQSDVEFMRAYWAYRDNVACIANQAFENALRRELKDDPA